MNYKDRQKARHNAAKRKRATRGRHTRSKGRAWKARKTQKGTRTKKQAAYLKGQGGGDNIQ